MSGERDGMVYVALEGIGLLGVPEYWIVDYRELGGNIGSPKQPAVTVCRLESHGG